jgi:hypothetical protein
MKKKMSKLSLSKTTITHLTLMQQVIVRGGEPVETHLRTECAISYGICYTDATCPVGGGSLQSCPGGLCPTVIPSLTCNSVCNLCWEPSGQPWC